MPAAASLVDLVRERGAVALDAYAPAIDIPVSADTAQKNPNTLKAFDQALNEGQQIADTNRGEVEKVLEKFLGLKPIVADLVALPTFPLGVDATRVQRTVTAMIRFGFIPKKFANFKVSSMVDSPG